MRSADGALETFEKKPDWFVEVHRGAGLEEHGGSVGRVLSYFADSYRCYIAKQTTANDYAEWNGFELLKESDLRRSLLPCSNGRIIERRASIRGARAPTSVRMKKCPASASAAMPSEDT